MRYLRSRAYLSLVPLLVVCGLLVSHSVAQAGADAVKLVVKDPQSGVEFEVRDPAMLGFMAFANLSQPLSESPVVSNGYEITRYWSNGPFDHFHYYPGTESTAGYIYYDGFIQGVSDSDGKWYRTQAEADRTMQQMLTAHGLSRPSAARPMPVALPMGLGITVAAIALIGIGACRSLLWKRLTRKSV